MLEGIFFLPIYKDFRKNMTKFAVDKVNIG